MFEWFTGKTPQEMIVESVQAWFFGGGWKFVALLVLSLLLIGAALHAAKKFLMPLLLAGVTLGFGAILMMPASTPKPPPPSVRREMVARPVEVPVPVPTASEVSVDKLLEGAGDLLSAVANIGLPSISGFGPTEQEIEKAEELSKEELRRRKRIADRDRIRRWNNYWRGVAQGVIDEGVSAANFEQNRIEAMERQRAIQGMGGGPVAPVVPQQPYGLRPR